MARRKTSLKRNIVPDTLFKSELLSKFINVLMNSGKKSIAETIVYKALDKVALVVNKSDCDIYNSINARKRILEYFEKMMDSLRPVVEVRSARIGGATYQVPVEVKFSRGMALAMRWIVRSASSRNEKGMIAQLAGEILDASDNKGGAIKKRDDMHRMAKANQAFAHYRW